MKYLYTLTLLLLSVSIFSQESTISGKFENYNGSDSLIFLAYTSASPTETKIFVSKKGEFKYTYNSNTIDFCKLYFNAQDFMLLIVTPGEKITIDANFQKLNSTYEVKGSSQTQILKGNNTELFKFVDTQTKLQQEFERKADSLEKAKAQFIMQAIVDNPSSLASLVLVELIDEEKYPEVLIMLDSTLFSLYPTNPIVTNFHASIKNRFHLKEGSQIPEITLFDQTGKEVSLSSLRGKVVLIDFWATWCRPCRAEIPNIKNAYAKYHDLGFEVLSVSTDKDKNAWLSFLTTEQMPWITVHDSEGKYSREFQVSSIPFILLVDQNGKIIAKNVRGPALEEMLSSIYGKK